MAAEDLLKSGTLDETLRALTDRVRKDPSDVKQRIFLFQLFAVLGDWERAVKQLKVCGGMDAQTLPMVQSYREAIVCELVREKVFAGEKAPMIFGQPEDWIALMVEALGANARGDHAAAARLRAEAFEAAPAVPGTADGQAFAWIADADMRLGPLLELVMNGNYYWVPFSAIRKLGFEAPCDLRDRVWTPVEITWANGGEVVGFIPTRYPDAANGSDEIRLAKVTEWEDLGSETYAGHGQRLFATDAGDLSLMDLREVSFDTGHTDG
jgi:type VI secretion system protein ImpE